VAYLRALVTVRKLDVTEGDQRFGVQIVSKALEAPTRRIAENAGWDGPVVVARVRDAKGAFGFNAATEVFEDLEKAGVIDPTKVSRTALQNAASVASLLLTTEAMVAEKPKKKAAGAGAGMGGMGGGGMEDMDY
jgi:chaperonin GroEL